MAILELSPRADSALPTPGTDSVLKATQLLQRLSHLDKRQHLYRAHTCIRLGHIATNDAADTRPINRPATAERGRSYLSRWISATSGETRSIHVRRSTICSTTTD
jgi:hypothetical protein